MSNDEENSEIDLCNPSPSVWYSLYCTQSCFVRLKFKLLIDWVIDFVVTSNCKFFTVSLSIFVPDSFLALYKSFAVLLFSLSYLLAYLSTSLSIVPFHFQAECLKQRLNLALVFFVFIFSSSIFLWIHVCFLFSWFSLSLLNQEIGWEEHLRNNYFFVGRDIKPWLIQSSFYTPIFFLSVCEHTL